MTRQESDLERELRLAKQDVDHPRPEFWSIDLARYRAAKAALEAAEGKKLERRVK